MLCPICVDRMVKLWSRHDAAYCPVCGYETWDGRLADYWYMAEDRRRASGRVVADEIPKFVWRGPR